ncbi:MAG: ABC transporter substrate-binding protein [Lachnospiraceae bacterium]|nr:ABC transporter substrate-binding protein [Lachnospiraceae bacterium]
MLKRNFRNKYIALLLIAALALSGCASTVSSAGTAEGNAAVSSDASKPEVSEDTVSDSVSSDDGKYSKVADSSEYSKTEKIDDSAYTPVTASELKDGEYLIDIESSSSMFKVADTLLVVSGNSMEAVLRIESDSYQFMYPGTAKEAASDTEDHYIRFGQNDAGDQLYRVPVEALDKALPFAAFSKKKQQWYDRTLLFKSDALSDDVYKESRYNTVSSLGIKDGTYLIDVVLEGGTGKASVESPSYLLVEDGVAAAMITWSSSNYDYMLVDGFKFDADIVDDRSTFIIPVKGFDYPMPVTADTTAMSKPYEIDYTLYFDSNSISLADLEGVAPSYTGMKIKEKIRPEYATGFTIDAFDNNIYRINAGSDKYLLVPKMTELPYGIPENVTVIRTPVGRAYVASSSSMDFFTQTGTLADVAYTSQEADKWTDPKVSSLVGDDTIHYIGKYDAPDYETLITGNADIAIENSMIYHSPETKEKLEELSIPVFVDLTSYEADPRGRVEWIKIYGLLTGEYGKAVRYFNGSCRQIEEAASENETSGKNAEIPTVAFFYINPKGNAGVRNPGDYISKMIEMAGGKYVPKGIRANKDKTSSSVDMSMEDFYLKAKDADILIYNSTLYGSPESLDDLVKDTALLDEFKAVKEGRVYATEDTMFQATCAAADQISDLSAIISGRDAEMKYFKKLK